MTFSSAVSASSMCQLARRILRQCLTRHERGFVRLFWKRIAHVSCMEIDHCLSRNVPVWLCRRSKNKKHARQSCTTRVADTFECPRLSNFIMILQTAMTLTRRFMPRVSSVSIYFVVDSARARKLKKMTARAIEI